MHVIVNLNYKDLPIQIQQMLWLFSNYTTDKDWIQEKVDSVHCLPKFPGG